jgi:4-aminobutyrate aminotransferase / (S)-3-amino-2-methylpropionate transaminase / 5-aminovalerate transaminase
MTTTEKQVGNKSAALFERRKELVTNGVGVFNPSTAVSAKGAIIIDADGRELIDFGGGIGVLNSGHCPEPVVKAIQEQAAKLIHTCFNVATYDVYMDLAEELISLFPHGEKTKVMLTCTGAESVENAIKIARQATKRQGIICFTDAFHGRTMMAMTLTAKPAYKLNCGPFAPETYRFRFPNHFRYGRGLSYDDFVGREIELLRESLMATLDPYNCAAIIVETVQGEGGFIPMPKAYMRELRNICDEFGILLILDEVQSGFGRTGEWAAFHHYDVTPDLSTWAKSMGGGMPIGCVIGKAEIMDAVSPGTIGGTYPGNPVCAAAALANIGYMKEIDINALARKVGETCRIRFEALREKCPEIGEVRGLGAMVAFPLVKESDPFKPDSTLCHDLMLACADRGLILLSAGTHKNVIRVLSPLVITDEQLNRGLDIIEEELMRLTGRA